MNARRASCRSRRTRYRQPDTTAKLKSDIVYRGYAMDQRTSTHRLRIQKARDALKRHGLAAGLVPSSDPHLSEYLPERWQGRQWLSGFTGSMGTLVVTLDTAVSLAGSRYSVQA